MSLFRSTSPRRNLQLRPPFVVSSRRSGCLLLDPNLVRSFWLPSKTTKQKKDRASKTRHTHSVSIINSLGQVSLDSLAPLEGSPTYMSMAPARHQLFRRIRSSSSPRLEQGYPCFPVLPILEGEPSRKKGHLAGGTLAKRFALGSSKKHTHTHKKKKKRNARGKRRPRGPRIDSTRRTSTRPSAAIGARKGSAPLGSSDWLRAHGKSLTWKLGGEICEALLKVTNF